MLESQGELPDRFLGRSCRQARAIEAPIAPVEEKGSVDPQGHALFFFRKQRHYVFAIAGTYRGEKPLQNVVAGLRRDGEPGAWSRRRARTRSIVWRQADSDFPRIFPIS